jgi:toxin ParE1/3/4
MNYELCITQEAEQDLQEIYLWYEGKRIGLGHDFLLQVDAKLRLVKRDPFLFYEIYKGSRRCLINRFPYKIFYKVEDQNVVVIAVVYGGRNPKWLKQRLKIA